MWPSWSDCALVDRVSSLVGKSYTAFMAGSSMAKVIPSFDSSCGSSCCLDFRRADRYCFQKDERLPLLAALSNTVVAWAAGEHSRMASNVLSFCALLLSPRSFTDGGSWQRVPRPSQRRCAFTTHRHTRLDVRDGVLNTLHCSRIRVRNFDVELVLERHQQLEGVERVGSKVVTEQGL